MMAGNFSRVTEYYNSLPIPVDTSDDDQFSKTMQWLILWLCDAHDKN